MNTKSLFLLILICIFFNTNAQKIIKGLVYEDVNANGKHDRKEKGIPGIPVSNGKEVVLTDQSGRYELPGSADDIIFVIKPTNFKTPVNQNNLPDFYYIHKPAGSPKLNFAGVEPTGELPGSVDFALMPVNENENFKILLFGDPQVYTMEEVNYFDKKIVSELVDVKNIPFGISLGDEVGNNPDLFLPYAEIIKKIGIPWYNVPGNHDLNHDATADSLSDESFEKAFGPSTYSFNYGKTHFIILKDILWPDPRDKEGYWGGFTQRQFAFLKNDLKYVPKDYLVVLAFHIPIWEGHVENDIFSDPDRETLFSILKDFPNTLTVSAHSHIQLNKLMSVKEGWFQEKPHLHVNLGTSCGSWYRGELDSAGIPRAVMSDGTPQGYAFLEVKKNQYNIRYKAAGYPEDYQMNIYHPRVVGRTKKPFNSIYVNFFMGNNNDELLFRVDEGNWKPMKYIVEKDPSYLHLLHRWDFSDHVIPGNRLADAGNCFHLWKAVLPADLNEGNHIIEVKATDVFGNIHYGKSSYLVATANL